MAVLSCRNFCILSVLVSLVSVLLGYYCSTGRSRAESGHRFNSFAPVREGEGHVKWFVDGEDYMSAVADAIKAAEYEIFITDWQIHPYVHLKRPENGVSSLEWRLDTLLLEKARNGTKIYILLYWETKSWPADMDLGSDFAVSVLNNTNITIRRHPSISTPVANPSTLLRWSHHEKLVVVDRSIAFVGGIDLCFGRWDTQAHPLTDNYPHHPSVLETETGLLSDERYCRWVGKDYGNVFYAGARTDFDKPFEDILDPQTGSPIRTMFPRMPWHDVSCSFSGDAALDASQHFIQRFNALSTTFWPLSALSEWAGSWDGTTLSKHWEYPKVDHAIDAPSTRKARVQVVRSVSAWSANQPHEDSILKAYLHAIENAEHSIYIENQFFISSQNKEMFRNVQNQIQAVLASRIARAYKDFEDFHVMIILPLKPEFPGEWGEESGSDLEAVSYWNYATLYSGEDCLFARLKEEGVPATSLHHYISVYGLRTHDILQGEFITEIIYVHSKMMIVDDRLAIIGSANINDRSMLGDRDSEVAVVIEDLKMINGEMNGKAYPVGKFSHSLRCNLVKEHLGLLQDDSLEFDIQDPVKYDFYEGVLDIATSNTLIYEQVFRKRILPTNQVWNKDDLENWLTFDGLADIFPEGAKDELNKIRGHIVIFPPFFLKDVLKPSALDYVGMFVDSRGQTSELNFDHDDRVFV